MPTPDIPVMSTRAMTSTLATSCGLTHGNRAIKPPYHDDSALLLDTRRGALANSLCGVPIHYRSPRSSGPPAQLKVRLAG